MSADEAAHELGPEWDLMDVEIEPVPIPSAPRLAPIPSYSLAAPRTPASTLTLRDAKAAALGAALVAALIGLARWFGRDGA